MFEKLGVYLIDRWEINIQKVAKYEDNVLPNIKERLDRESSYTINWIVR
jgi:hypothetical protein